VRQLTAIFQVVLVVVVVVVVVVVAVAKKAIAEEMSRMSWASDSLRQYSYPRRERDNVARNLTI
jgi:hypothetical protein